MLRLEVAIRCYLTDMIHSSNEWHFLIEILSVLGQKHHILFLNSATKKMLTWVRFITTIIRIRIMFIMLKEDTK